MTTPPQSLDLCLSAQGTVRPIPLDPHLVSSHLYLQHVTQGTGFSKCCWLDERTDEQGKEVAEGKLTFTVTIKSR